MSEGKGSALVRAFTRGRAAMAPKAAAVKKGAAAAPKQSKKKVADPLVSLCVEAAARACLGSREGEGRAGEEAWGGGPRRACGVSGRWTCV
jgi:hypothetical protein